MQITYVTISPTPPGSRTDSTSTLETVSPSSSSPKPSASPFPLPGPANQAAVAPTPEGVSTPLRHSHSIGSSPSSTTTMSESTSESTTPSSSTVSSPTPSGTALAFGGFGAPPNQTDVTPCFGQPAAQSAPQNLWFGATPQAPAYGTQHQAFAFNKPDNSTSLFTSTPAWSFSAPQLAPTSAPQNLWFGATTQAPAYGTQHQAFVFNKPDNSTSLFTSTPAWSFSAPQLAPTSTTSTAPQTSQCGFSLGAATTATINFDSATSSRQLGEGSRTSAPDPALPEEISSMTFAELEENINKWTLDLEEQEKTFHNQAAQINAGDRLLIANQQKIVKLNEAIQSVKNEQDILDREIDFVLAQQGELGEVLAPLERQLLDGPANRLRDPEREHMYSLAENLDTRFRQTSDDLKELIENLNETNRSQDSNDPVVQIGRILNAHMSSMQWLDNTVAQMSTKLDQLKATHDTLRRDNERSFQLAFNSD